MPNNKVKKPEWNVYIDDFNAKRIKIYNIFEHDAFIVDCNTAWKKYKNDFSKFEESVKRSLTYFFWSKCEYEIILSDLFECEKFKKEKIDVYKQVMLNWNIFINYLWDFYKDK